VRHGQRHVHGLENVDTVFERYDHGDKFAQRFRFDHNVLFWHAHHLRLRHHERLRHGYALDEREHDGDELRHRQWLVNGQRHVHGVSNVDAVV